MQPSPNPDHGPGLFSCPGGQALEHVYCWRPRTRGPVTCCTRRWSGPDLRAGQLGDATRHARPCAKMLIRLGCRAGWCPATLRNGAASPGRRPLNAHRPSPTKLAPRAARPAVWPPPAPAAVPKLRQAGAAPLARRSSVHRRRLLWRRSLGAMFTAVRCDGRLSGCPVVHDRELTPDATSGEISAAPRAGRCSATPRPAGVPLRPAERGTSW